jgi:hypothetical protein
MMQSDPEYLKYLMSLASAKSAATPAPATATPAPATPAPATPSPATATAPATAPSVSPTFPEPAPLPPREIVAVKRTLSSILALPADEFQREISAMYAKYKWDSPIVKNGCDTIAAPGQQGKPVSFTRTQDFIRHYLTPESPFKGLLAWHSVGTGKTCMAVAAATSFFEKAGYTILWVTRNSLMSDVYKNIFGSVCSIPIIEAVERGATIPSDITKAKRMLSRQWAPPISYRTFQNALEKKNELGRLLYKKNPTDPLHKTFLIMDEVHKLQDGDLSAAEAADFKTIQKYIHASYSTSGNESVRPLLMTATPITDTPHELFEIVNTLIGDPEYRLAEFKTFRETYTNAKGEISDAGSSYFQSRAKGLISYLNREFDPTTFAQPIFHNETIRLEIPNPPTVTELVDRCLAKQPKPVPGIIDNKYPLDSYIIESIVEQDCSRGFEKELEDIDDEITKTETMIVDLGKIGREKNAETAKKREIREELKKRISELKELFSSTRKNQVERKRQCDLANKESMKLMKTLETLARRKKGGVKKESNKLEECYHAEHETFTNIYKKRNQLVSIQSCFPGQNSKTRKVPFVNKSDFLKELKERRDKDNA